MEKSDFKKLLNNVHEFNNLQFRLLKEEIEKRIRKKKVSNILETDVREMNCPFCNSDNFIRWGKRNDMQRYKCHSCLKTFNSLTNTPLARLRRKGHWLDYANCIKLGLTVRKAAKFCRIHKNTSFRWRHRFLENSKNIKAKKIGGIIENGHLKLKESFKGSKIDEIIKKEERRNVYVVYGIDRNNNIFDITDKPFTSERLTCEFSKLILKNSLIFSEKDNIYAQFWRKTGHKHSFLTNISKKLSYSGNIIKYKERFNNWIFNHFRSVATKYLENYVSWYRYLNEFKSGIKPLTILYRAKSVEKYRHQPLKVTRFI
ncbi:MAG: hypothetical protein N4A49_00545 [Marinifilaceae bacterium]|jgi:transposase-like protein|nr:hypothetical protein [Marinifilaceae bacterium]